MRDVVVVGGGIAGLTAGWRLRQCDVVVMESDSRVGGRIRSERRGRYWMNWGGHVFAGLGSATAALLESVDVAAVPVPGSLSGLSMNGKLLIRGRVETYPLRVPMAWSARLAVLRAGARVGVSALRYAQVARTRPDEDQAARQQRVYDFLNDRSFADYIGDLPEDAEALFRPTVTRSSGDPDEISAGAGVGYFALVWNAGQGLGQSIVGGPSTLTHALATGLDERVWPNTTVVEVVQKPSSVQIRYRQGECDGEVEARCVVMATPATVTHRVVRGLDPALGEALARIRYGPYVSAAFLTDERDPRPWDDAYAIATPKRSFNVVLNLSNVVRASESRRQAGSSVMTFSAARLARELLERSDDEILRTYTDDLDQVLPGFAESVVEAQIQRWPTGAPYCFPGRGALQPVLTRPRGRVLLAGDFLGTFYTDTAICTGSRAANEALSLLALEPSTKESYT